MAAVLAVVLGLSLWTNHLTDHIGYGSSLVVGLVGSLVSAVVGVRAAQVGRGRRGATVAVAAVLSAFAFVLVPLVIVLARGLVAPACAPASGAAYALLFALPGPV